MKGGTRSRASAAAGAFLLLALTVPFAGKAYEVDDPLYLEAARHVLKAPLDPLGGASFWHERPTTLFHDLYNPPLTAYLLALPVALGGSEWAMHLLTIVLAALALVATAFAGEAVGVAPRWTLLLAASPALAVSALGAMADTPFLLLSVLAWWAAFRGRPVAAGALAGASALTKYAGLLNVPLTALAPGGSRRRAIAAAVAIILFGAWCLWNLAAYGEMHVRAAARFQEIGLRHQGTLILSFVASLGLAGLPAALGLLRWRMATGTVLLAAGLGGAGLLYIRTGSVAGALLAFAAFGSGAALLVAAIRASLRPGAGFPAWSFWLYSAQAMLLVYFGATRYLLVLLPPLLWLLVRGGELDTEARPWRWAVAVGAGLLLSMAFLWADAGYANAWRAAAAGLPPGERGLHTGRWGFDWYASSKGYRALSRASRHGRAGGSGLL